MCANCWQTLQRLLLLLLRASFAAPYLSTGEYSPIMILNVCMQRMTTNQPNVSVTAPTCTLLLYVTNCAQLEATFTRNRDCVHG